MDGRGLRVRPDWISTLAGTTPRPVAMRALSVGSIERETAEEVLERRRTQMVAVAAVVRPFGGAQGMCDKDA